MLGPFDSSPPSERGLATRAVATAFLRKRPWIVFPMMLTVVITLVAGDGPQAQVITAGGLTGVALSFFAWEAVRGRRRLTTARALLVSLVVTLLGIGLAAFATGGVDSPLLYVGFAPTVVGFAAFGRGWRSDLLFGLALAVLFSVALVPAEFPFPPLSWGARRLLTVVCASHALLLLRVGVAALTDAHTTARNVAATAGESAVASAEARSRALESMGAKVAHEVRNPLSAIRALVEVLAESAASPRATKQLSVVLSEVDRIDQILREYLALARPLEQLEPRHGDVGVVLRETAAVLEARAEQAGVGLDVHAPALPASFDPRRLKEALLNLALNALEATPPGGRILLSATRAGAGVMIRVEDTGAGMARDRLTTLGQPFVSGRAGGVGLGMALARQAIVQHGGTLDFQSVEGRGTVASIMLPLRPEGSA